MTEAFLSTVMDVHGDCIYRLALCLLQNKADAEDAFQDTFMAFFQERGAGKWDEQHIKAWLLRVAVNKCNDIARRRKRLANLDMDIQISNRSEKELVKTFAQFKDTGLGITIHSLTIEETELGMYAQFVYSTNDNETYHFALMDANGEYLSTLPAGGPAYEDNGDGTYRSAGTYQKLDSLDGLQFRVMRSSDGEKIGPFKILG